VQPRGFDGPIATDPKGVNIVEAERFQLLYDGRVRHKALIQAKTNFNLISFIFAERE